MGKISSQKQALPMDSINSTKKQGRYEIVEKLGGGSHAFVWMARDSVSSEMVAIKQVIGTSAIFSFDPSTTVKPLANFPPELAKRTLREIKILQHLKGSFSQFPNVVTLKDVFLDNDAGQFSVCLVMDIMKCDLHQLIISSVKFSQNHIILFIYQILRGLKAIHSANIIHRDLKPSNILVNEDLLIKLCDFGTGRGNQTGDQLRNTLLSYVATTYYRAPEGLLDQVYTTTVDIWSVGCILAELILRRPLFQVNEDDGRMTDDKQLLNTILKTFGTPPSEVLSSYSSSKIKDLRKTNFPLKTPAEILPNTKEIFTDSKEQVYSLFSQLMEFNHNSRITASKALEHEIFSQLHDPQDEPTITVFDDPEKNEQKNGRGGLSVNSKPSSLEWHKLLRREVKNWQKL